MALVGKGPLTSAVPPKGPPPGAKIAIKGSGPPPGKVPLPKPQLSSSAAGTKTGSPTKTLLAPGSGVLPKPPLPSPTEGHTKPALPLAKRELPKLPPPPTGTKATNNPLKSLWHKNAASPTKPLPENIPDATKQQSSQVEEGAFCQKSATPKSVLPAEKGLPGGHSEAILKDGSADGSPKSATVAPGPVHSAASKASPGTSIPQKSGPAGFSSAAKVVSDLPTAATESSGLAGATTRPLGHTSPISSKGGISAGLATSSNLALSPETKPGIPSTVVDGAATLPNVTSPGVDEFGRQRGSVGDLAPKSELTHDLLGNVIPVFDKSGKFVAFASGPPAPLARSDPARRSRRLLDRKPQERDTMKMPSARGFDSVAGSFGGLTVPGGIPGFFLSVPPWPAPTPMPMDQVAGWGAYNQLPGCQFPQISPYTAFPPQPVPQANYPTMYGPTGGGGKEQHGCTRQQGTFEPASWPGYPGYPVHPDADDARGSASSHFPGRSKVANSPRTHKQKVGRPRRSRGLPLDDLEGSRARGNVVTRGNEEMGKSKWTPIERHLNNIRGGYGEAYRPLGEETTPPRKPSARARHRSSSVRDDVYSGFRPYYLRDKKPFVDEDIPRVVELNESTSRLPVPPRKSPLMTRPKDRTWDRWGSTGLTAPRKRTYQSLSELASCFSSLEAEDQDDVISLLLLCRKLEQQVEKQHVVIDMLEHELSEAQKVLKFPPEWRTLEGVDLAGMVPSDAPFQATAAAPLYIKSASVLPSNVPDDPNANFGVKVPLTRESKVASAAPTSPTKTATAPPAAGAGVSKTAGGTAEALKKPPALFKPKPSVMGFKKPVFKKM